MRAVAYIRASTDKQSITLEAQELKIRQMAAVKDAEIIDVIIEAESGKSLERPGMTRLLEMVDLHEVDMVIVAKLDRITRSLSDIEELLKRFRKNNVALVSVADNIDLDSATGRMVINFIVMISQWERETIGERTETALSHLKDQGLSYSGSRPFGYTAPVRTDEDRKNRFRHPLVECPREQAILARVKELRAAGASYDAIAFDLNEQGFRTRGGGPWVFQTVARIWKGVKK
jgi:DNA invertase Pin-like site-specific DNA recombinase